MADPLYELLAPHLKTTASSPSSATPLSAASPIVTSYLSRLTTLSLSALSATEPQSLAQSSSSNLLSLQALSSRSHRSVIATSNALSTLGGYLPALTSSVSSLRDGVPELDEKALDFSQKYSKSNTENAVLDRRKKAMLLSRNVDKVSDILELPTLLASAIASSSAPAGSAGSAPSGVNYSQALDLFAHIKRLQIMHPDSAVIQSVLTEAKEAMKDMTSNLITSLRGQNVRLAAAIRTIGWLRRVAPELAAQGLPQSSTKSAQSNQNSTRGSVPPNSEGSFGYLFLTCRLYNLINMLEALAPLRDLADQETQLRLLRQSSSTILSPSHDLTGAQKKLSMYGHSAFSGQQTERYLKRYIEIFREQSFATVSMYKNIFPAASDTTINAPLTPQTHNTTSSPSNTALPPPPFLDLPSPLSTFPTHLISLLTETLQQYLPNLADPSARDSLLMQILYAAGSLGRLGADFSLVVESLLDGEEDEEEDGEGDDEPEAVKAGVDDEKESAEAETEAEGVDGIHHNNDDQDEDDDARTSPPPSTTKRPGPTQNQPPHAKDPCIPEWIRILQKHRLQSSRLEALSSSQEQQQQQSRTGLSLLRKGSADDTVVK
jgi:conserved oligomeric Golgi complex subunit 8